MSFYKFDKNEIILNSVRSHPETRLYVETGSIYYNNATLEGVRPISHISGSTLNVAQNSWNCRPLFVSASAYDSPLVLPDQIWTKDYYLSSSANISSDYITGSAVSYPHDPPDRRLTALKNTLNNYVKNSVNYAFSSSIEGNSFYKPEQDLMLVSVPSILYGSQIQPGTVNLNFYYTGSLAGRLTDSTMRGDLQDEEGRVAGVVLYNEGFLLLTGSWDINPDVSLATTGQPPKWRNFALQDVSETQASFEINFNGTTHTPTMTMFAHASRGELNSSNNPTFIQHSSSVNANDKILVTGSYMYVENDKRTVENVVSSSFATSGTFEKTTYLSSIGIYDDDNNLIGVAKLATPVRKREKDSYTFKLKLDM